MTLLTTQRLRLEPYTEAHTEGLFILNSNTDVMRYITGRPLSMEETVNHIQHIKECWAHYGFSSWSIIESSTGQIIGSCGVQHLEFNPDNPIEIGWRIIPQKWGKGFATEAAKAIMDFAFNNQKFQLVYAVCHKENLKSVRVMKKLGMNFHGIERWYDIETKVFTLSRVEYAMRNHALKKTPVKSPQRHPESAAHGSTQTGLGF